MTGIHRNIRFYLVYRVLNAILDLNNDVHRIAPFTTVLHVFSLITREFRGKRLLKNPSDRLRRPAPLHRGAFSGAPAPLQSSVLSGSAANWVLEAWKHSANHINKRPPHVSGGLLFMNFLNLLTLPTWAPLHWKRSHWTQKGIAARRLLPTCAIPCFTSFAVGRGSFAVMKNAVRGPPESCTLRIFAFARIFGKRITKGAYRWMRQPLCKKVWN